ncbi:MAG: DUF305 domain-containing protein [Cupriavidus sp.]|jgi:uncharacterized protein (DUF305 family)|uniref:CopM family metallochaperone n=1 Tax=unclassified Methylobacterium TaxID=2615210 RepID=UPI0005BA9472|nr:MULTISPECIES: DUF305 domain-containing protein [unclassified Methylobacterium]MBU69312.1 DUF305 domain-containing protein [Cupriavidus sp.]MBP31660.1 DUF305 domain-containing protein [Methylobacterium sp.]MDE4913864.1 DUF305 domain-containing protein [Methylobacterium sp. 092160098-2]WFS09353.1 DUF305 domain-containing protein [Methylobacterium sp. 391_Methyba4]SFU72204.1 protein of unknown function [Methylobacterium sp. UNCCL125]
MTVARTLLAAALLTAGLAGTARAQGLHDHGSMSGQGRGSMKPDPKDDASTRAFKAADQTMMRDMDVPYTGDPDVDFRTHMIPHHKGAVAMAEVALKYARDPATQAMARKIIADQTTEIADMEAWLKRHGR